MRTRLQKALAAAGVCSRRKAETLIAQGRVRVDGKIVQTQGTIVDPKRAKIEVDGRRIVTDPPTYLLLHKPRGVVSTLSDPEGRETLAPLLAQVRCRVFPVGRLDYHTSGVLLATNDGELSEALLRPSSKVVKEYLAKVPGEVGDRELEQLRNGVVLDDGYRTKEADVFVEREDAQNSWVRLRLTEGKNRQVHRMFDAVGIKVRRLVRLSFGELTAEGLKPGQWRPLDAKEVDRLKKRYLIPHRGRARAKKRAAKISESQDNKPR